MSSPRVRKSRASTVNALLEGNINPQQIPDGAPTKISPRSNRSRDSTTNRENDNAAPLMTSRKTIDELKEFLYSKGYKISQGTYIGSGDNAVLSFVKASYMGYPVYIHLDRDFSSISPVEKDLSVIEILPGEVSSPRENDLAERCTSVDCSTMVECVGKFCSIRRNPSDGFIQKTDYVMTTKTTQRHIRGTEDIFAYPAVNISEIMANNNAVVINIRRHSTRLRNKSRKQYVDMRIESLYIMNALKSMHKKLDDLLNHAQHHVEDEYDDAEAVLDGIKYPSNANNQEVVEEMIANFNAVNEERALLYRDLTFLNVTNDELTQVLEQFASLYVDISRRTNQHEKIVKDPMDD